MREIWYMAIAAVAVSGIKVSDAHAIDIPLTAREWDIQYSYDMRPKPSAYGKGWAFEFPKGTDCPKKCPGVHYVTTPHTKVIEYGAELTVTGEIIVTGTPSFNYKLEKANTCIYPAHGRPYVQIKNDDLYNESGRFWSGTAIHLAPGKFSITVTLDDNNWTNVDGKRDKEGLKRLLAKMGRIGLTFGGGCFYGHGVNVSGGTAKFVVTGFIVN